MDEAGGTPYRLRVGIRLGQFASRGVAGVNLMASLVTLVSVAGGVGVVVLSVLQLPAVAAAAVACTLVAGLAVVGHRALANTSCPSGR